MLKKNGGHPDLLCIKIEGTPRNAMPNCVVTLNVGDEFTYEDLKHES